MIQFLIYVSAILLLARVVWFFYRLYSYKNTSTPEDVPSNGKIVLVTGATFVFQNILSQFISNFYRGGLGFPVVQKLISKGVIVIATDINEELLRDHFKSFSEKQLFTVSMDVSSLDSILQAKKKVETFLQGRKLFAILNNAGVGVPLFGSVVEQTDEAMLKLMNINSLGVFRVTREFYPFVGTHDKSVIVNVASVAGILAAPFMSFYNASKFSVVGFSDTLRREISQKGQRFVCIEPVFTKTPIVQVPRENPNSQFKYSQTVILHRELQTPDVVANVIVHSMFCTSVPEHRMIDFYHNQILYYLVAHVLPYTVSDWILHQIGKMGANKAL